MPINTLSLYIISCMSFVWLRNKKKDKKSDRAKKEDRLSKLPDEIIHRILSNLDVKVVVQTSILSKRWRYFWVFVPCLTSMTHHSLILHFSNISYIISYLIEILPPMFSTLALKVIVKSMMYI